MLQTHRSLIIPDTVTTIGAAAFNGCSGFTGNLVISNGVTVIGTNTFNGCSGFAGTLTLPSGLKSIENYAFYSNGTYHFTGTLVLPDGLEKIGVWAFGWCGFTGDLTIPNSVTNMGHSAFYRCVNFDGTLTLSTGVTSYQKDVFHDCWNLTGDLVIPEGVTSIEDKVFCWCHNFNGNLVLPSTLKTIGKQAFERCENLKGDLTIPEGVTLIDDFAFRGCGGFTGTLTVPSTVTKIGTRAFSYYSHDYTGDPTPTYISMDFAGVKFMPTSTLTIGYRAFSFMLPTVTDTKYFPVLSSRNQGFLDSYGSPKTGFYYEYGITYVLDGGINDSSNPDRYRYGTGVPSFADASKPGLVFQGWFKESTFTNPVVNIPATKTGTVTVYAKFTKLLPVPETIDDATYSGSAQAPVLTIMDGATPLVSGTDYDFYWSPDSTFTDAKTYVATLTGKGKYHGTQSATYIIKPKVLTVTTDSGSKTYDGTAFTVPTGTLTGLVEPETATLNITGTQTDAGSSPNTFTITYGTAKESNYTVTENLGTLTVDKKTVTVTPKTGQTKVYGEIDPSEYTYDLSETISVTGKLSREGDMNAGSHKITIGSLEPVSSNYKLELSATAVYFEITKKTVTVTPSTHQSRVYDGTSGASGLTYGNTGLAY